ncbi:MAG TPA: stalk domain-containing protein [Candidatus Udaeobacter sp.]|nr:stalk domain-containing protein [Candidatus Udaeobacter sp.]
MQTMKWLMFICLFFTLADPVAAKGIKHTAPPLTMYIDGTKLATTPFVKEGTVFIPIRAALEHMGANVIFSEKKIIVKRAETEIIMEPGQRRVSINGESVSVTTPPIVIKGSTFVPLRFFGNALGYEVLYQPSAKRVVLHTSGNQAVVYGYVENLDGEGIQQGVVLLEDVAAGITYEVPVRNGFYRINVMPHTYRFKGYRDNLSQGDKLVNQQEPFEVSSGQTAFYKLSPSQSGLKVTLRDPNGTPIAQASASFNTSHGAVYVDFRNGVGYLDFYEPGDYNFNDLNIEEGAETDYDIYHPFTIGEDGVVTTLEIIAHPSNITGQVAGESETVYGNLDICSTGEDKACYVQGAPGGAFSFYLPDGDFEWYSYYDSSIRQHFNVNIDFSVKDGITQSNLQWSKPIINIHGSASTNEGKSLSGGYIRFYGSGEEYSAWVEKGEFSCYVPDGTYSVSYEQYFDGFYLLTLNESIKVTSGKLSISPELVFYLS